MNEELKNSVMNLDAIPQEEEPSSFRLIFSLGLAGLISGILLVATYLFTLPYIEANKAEALQRAIFMVLPNCESFNTLELVNGKLVEVSEENGQDKKSGKQGKETEKIFAGFDGSGNFIGFAIPGSQAGFQDIIGAIYGYDASQKIIIGFEVLESKETPGLGDKIFKDVDFRANFERLSVEPEIVPVKKGKKENANEVETITGATISSKAVVQLINNSIEAWRVPISEFLENKQITKTPE